MQACPGGFALVPGLRVARCVVCGNLLTLSAHIMTPVEPPGHSSPLQGPGHLCKGLVLKPVPPLDVSRGMLCFGGIQEQIVKSTASTRPRTDPAHSYHHLKYAQPFQDKYGLLFLGKHQKALISYPVCGLWTKTTSLPRKP